MTNPAAPTARDEDLFFRARTTQIQFAALAHRCRSGTLRDEIAALRYYQQLRAARNADIQVVQKWLCNGWNTEMLLRQNLATLDGEGLRNSLQWAFPQAYYAAYTVACAFFAAVGFTEASHTGVIAKYGKQIAAGSYPRTLSFMADGAPQRTYLGLGECELATPLHLDPANADNVDTHLRRFLNATRDDDLKQRRRDMRGTFRTTQHRPRQNLRPEDWAVVSDRLGPTSLLSLLYRKRIKANYRDIDTFLCEDLDAAQLYKDLIFVVSCCNITHEAFISRALGHAAIADVAATLVPRGHRFLTRRVAGIIALEV